MARASLNVLPARASKTLTSAGRGKVLVHEGKGRQGQGDDAALGGRLAAERKTDGLDSASDLMDLLSPAGNRLEKLRGDRAGQHSIRINDHWRICFVWMADGPYEVGKS